MAEELYNGIRNRRLPTHLHRVAMRKLRYLDNAVDLNDLRIPPGNRLEKLSGDRKGQHSIRINDQYRICFSWKNGDAYHVEIIDYH
ncbi:MAG: type II toxin-antitoxin system RelE/ParE family toxin [Gammaproteobacteria bacterium]